jgi:hypothetical protein
MQRSVEKGFKDTEKGKYETDFILIQQDLLKFNYQNNPAAYYQCAHKLLALIENLETSQKSSDINVS